MKKLLALFLGLVLCAGLVSCGIEPEDTTPHDPLEGETVTTVYDGRWSDGAGAVLLLDSSGCYYYLQTAEGRCGRGSYLPREAGPSLNYFGVEYRMIWREGSLILSGEGEWNDASFFRDDRAELHTYPVSDLVGSWSNEEGVQISFSEDPDQFRISDGPSGSLSDNGDGRGYVLTVGTEEVYPVLSLDADAMILLGGEGLGLTGTFLRDLAKPGVNDEATLAQYSHYYDTWYQSSSKVRASVTLNADGTWESRNRMGSKTGEGIFFVSPEGQLILCDRARRYVGTAYLAEDGTLVYETDHPDHDDRRYSPSSQSF